MHIILYLTPDFKDPVNSSMNLYVRPCVYACIRLKPVFKIQHNHA